jgi:hypothetical protein
MPMSVDVSCVIARSQRISYYGRKLETMTENPAARPPAIVGVHIDYECSSGVIVYMQVAA